MKKPMKKLNLKKIKMWYLLLPLLTVSNLAYLPKNFIGWVITLAFFLFVPGYLLLSCLKHEIESRWEIASFSLGFSLLLMMVGGLLLNSLHTFGLTRPLSTTYIFILLDAITLALLAFNRKRVLNFPSMKLHPSIEHLATVISLTMLPLLAIGGAIRLNNGASNILTMILFAAAPILFILLIWRKNLKTIYPYAVFMIGLSVLFSTSLRGWSITGHDIQHEFRVFQIVSNNGFWNIAHPKGDPYNACLSITILPTIIAKITTISAPYVFKVVFQAIFAFGLIPIYFFMRKLVSTRYALIGALIFISFPPFFNDMPFLNRQEIAFVFFSLLMLTTFMNLARKPKTILTILFLLGVILSHYSSGYITVGLLVLSWLLFKILALKNSAQQSFILPVLSLPIIIVALLFTFLWNAQVTATTAGLRQTVTQTIQGLWGHASDQSSSVEYSLLSPPTLNPVQVLSKYAGSNTGQVHYVAPSNLPVTKTGKVVSHIVNVESLNNGFRTFCARILQILLLVGLVVFFSKRRKKMKSNETYFFALAISCVILLILITVLPEISVDYSVTRLFQQTLIITAVPIVMAAEFLLGFLGRFKLYGLALLFAFLFLDLSGFVPQLFGGYPPQLALNNSGTYYDIYYVHRGEVIATDWLTQVNRGKSVAADSYGAIRFPGFPFESERIINPVFAGTHGYLYQDYANTHNGLYASFLSGDLLEYTYKSPIANGNLVYSNQDSKIYHN
jgi:uncharacterized membrane protein